MLHFDSLLTFRQWKHLIKITGGSSKDREIVLKVHSRINLVRPSAYWVECWAWSDDDKPEEEQRGEDRHQERQVLWFSLRGRQGPSRPWLPDNVRLRARRWDLLLFADAHQARTSRPDAVYSGSTENDPSCLSPIPSWGVIYDYGVARNARKASFFFQFISFYIQGEKAGQ